MTIEEAKTLDREQVESRKKEIDDLILSIIQKEIAADPMSLGYHGKSAEDIVQLLNTPYSSISGEGEIQQEIQNPPRIYQILVGIPDAPNVITKEMLV